MSKFYLYYSLISTISFLFGSIIFFCAYNSVEGGIWAAFAGCVAGTCFHLYKLYDDNKFQQFFSLKAFHYLTIISFVICLVGVSFSIFYAFAIVYWKIPLRDYKRTLVFPCVFSFLTGKWGYHLHSASKKCISEYMLSNYSPLIQSVI